MLKLAFKNRWPGNTFLSQSGSSSASLGLSLLLKMTLNLFSCFRLPRGKMSWAPGRAQWIFNQLIKSKTANKFGMVPKALQGSENPEGKKMRQVGREVASALNGQTL